jgi:hypothetical protein
MDRYRMEPQTHELFALGLTSPSRRANKDELMQVLDQVIGHMQAIGNMQVIEDAYYHDLLSSPPILGTGIRSCHTQEPYELRDNIRQIHNCVPAQVNEGRGYHGGNRDPEIEIWSGRLDSEGITLSRNIHEKRDRYREATLDSGLSSSFIDNSREKGHSNQKWRKLFDDINTEYRIHGRELQEIFKDLHAALGPRLRPLSGFQTIGPGELNFRQRRIIEVLESVSKDWWKASFKVGTGTFPLNPVEKISGSLWEELQQQQAQTEKEVFADIQNVKKRLLALLMLMTSSQPTELKDWIKDKDGIEVSRMPNLFIQFL